MTVCDFGCGNGLLMPHLCPNVDKYFGVDFSEEFIDAANRRKSALGYNNATFVCADINNFCAQHESCFDAGFAMDFSEHVPDDEWLDILRSIRHAIKPNKKLYLHTPNARFIIEIMKKHNFILKQFPEHVAVRDATENIKLLRQAGFSNINSIALPHYNILKYLHILSYAPVVGKYFEARLFIEATA